MLRHLPSKIQVHQNHFHQKSNVIKSTFIIYQFHQKTVSSIYTLSSKTTLIKNQIESWDRTKHDWGGKNNTIRISVKAKAGDAPHEGLLKVESGGLGVQGVGLRLDFGQFDSLFSTLANCRLGPIRVRPVRVWPIRLRPFFGGPTIFHDLGQFRLRPDLKPQTRNQP